MWMIKLQTGIGEFRKPHQNVTLLFCWKIVGWLPSHLCYYPHSFVWHLDLTDSCKVISLLTTVTPLCSPPFCFSHWWSRSPLCKGLHRTYGSQGPQRFCFFPSWFLHVITAVLLCCRSPVLVLCDSTQYTSTLLRIWHGERDTKAPLLSNRSSYNNSFFFCLPIYFGYFFFFYNCHT